MLRFMKCWTINKIIYFPIMEDEKKTDEEVDLNTPAEPAPEPKPETPTEDTPAA